MTPKRRAVLHIGTEKTGTTSIQNVMSKLRPTFPEQGYAYPLSAGSKNHLRLAAYAGDPERVADIRKDVERTPGGGGPVERFAEDLAAEMAALPDSVHTVIFSGEHCHSRLLTVESVGRLKDLLAPYFASFQILVYFRRQDELAISHYSTKLRNGARKAQLLPRREGVTYYDYAALVDRWTTVFGAEALRPRLYGRSHFLNGDLIEDFLAACGLGAVTVPPMSNGKNPSLTAAAQEFLRRFNPTEAGMVRPRPRWVFTFLDENFAGRGMVPTRDAARAFLAQFAEGNERIRERFFPERESLFSDDVSAYPEQEVSVPDSAVLEVAMAVVEHLSQRVAEGGNRQPSRWSDRPHGPRPGARGEG